MGPWMTMGRGAGGLREKDRSCQPEAFLPPFQASLVVLKVCACVGSGLVQDQTLIQV